MADSILLECPLRSVDQVEAIEARLYGLSDCPWVIELDADGNRPTLRGYFRDVPDAEEAFARLQANLGLSLGDADTRTLDSRDWEHAYRDHFHAWATRGLHCVPEWQRHSYAVPPGELAVYVDPGLAFGTGTHATTRLCLERMLDVCEQWRDDLAHRSVLDVGCGSGLLSIVAVRMGFRPVSGFDLDPDAVAISRQNAKLNGIDDQLELFAANVLDGVSVARDLVLANIHRNAVCSAAPGLFAATAASGALVVSGFLEPDVMDVMDALRAAAQSEPVTLETRALDDWAEVTLWRNRG